MSMLVENRTRVAPRPAATGLELGAARSLIGQRLRLRAPLLGFEAGTPCRVQCVVDFGDGLLLWVTTDDARQADVDQIDADDLERLFALDAVASAPRPGRSAPPPGAMWAEDGARRRTRSGPGRWLARLGAGIAAVAASLPASLETARYAERMLSMSDAQLAARGMRREQVMDHLRERLCRTGWPPKAGQG